MAAHVGSYILLYVSSFWPFQMAARVLSPNISLPKLFNPEPKLSLPQVNWSSSKFSEVTQCQLCLNLIEVHPMLNSP